MGGGLPDAFDAWEEHCREYDHEPWSEKKQGEGMTDIKTWQPWTETEQDGKRILGPLTPPEGGVVMVDVDLFASKDPLSYGDVLFEVTMAVHVFKAIEARPETRFLLWTEHPERVRELWPFRLANFGDTIGVNTHLSNVLLYAKASTQDELDSRAPELLKCRDLFGGLGLLLNPVEALDPWQWFPCVNEECECHEVPPESRGMRGAGCGQLLYGINSILVRGESEPVHPDRVRSLRDQCRAAGVPFAFLGWGEWAVDENTSPFAAYHAGEHEIIWADGSRGSGNINDNGPGYAMIRVGREHSGRLLDGREYLELPEVGE